MDRLINLQILKRSQIVEYATRQRVKEIVRQKPVIEKAKSKFNKRSLVILFV